MKEEGANGGSSAPKEPQQEEEHVYVNEGYDKSTV